jgi:hypothetical protein
MNKEKKMDFAQVKAEIEIGSSVETVKEETCTVVSSEQSYPPAFQPIFDAHDLVADLYEQIPAANKWKRLAMRKALLNPKLRKAEEAVSEQCRIVLDDQRPAPERDLAARRIAEGMQYWQQLILGRS